MVNMLMLDEIIIYGLKFVIKISFVLILLLVSFML